MTNRYQVWSLAQRLSSDEHLFSFGSRSGLVGRTHFGFKLSGIGFIKAIPENSGSCLLLSSPVLCMNTRLRNRMLEGGGPAPPH